MPKLVKPLVASAAAVGLAAWIGIASTHTRPPADPVSDNFPEPAGLHPRLADDPSAAEKPPANTVPVSAAVKFAVTPKPLSESVKKGLAFLAKEQQDDGGWNQGGGWRTNLDGKGGRVEGPKVEDPSDVGNTCIALLAFIRAGNTPAEGEYAANVRKGLAFVLDKVDKSDSESLHVTDVRNTQLQSKIGPYVDTFLANLVLAELKGKGGELEKRLVAALDKTVNKIVKHQGKDGQFAGNGGWAPVLSQGIANKALTRSKLAGAKVADEVLDRAAAQSQLALAKPTTAAGVSADGAVRGATGGLAGPGAAGPAGRGGGAGVGGPASAPGDAGVALYSVSQGAGNYQDVANALKVDADKAKKITEDAKASREEKEAAKKTLDRYAKLRDANQKAQAELAKQIKSDQFVAGFGSNGGEEFLSFLNIAEALVAKGGKDWEEWDAKMTQAITRVQDKNGSWSGHHCITGKTFCTAAALLVLTADRTPVPADPPAKAESREPAGGKK
jgi:hypothetical protein